MNYHPIKETYTSLAPNPSGARGASYESACTSLVVSSAEYGGGNTPAGRAKGGSHTDARQNCSHNLREIEGRA